MNIKTNLYPKKEETIDKILRPFQDFVNAEVSGGLVLISTVILALIIANSPIKDNYFSFWNTTFTIAFGNSFVLSKALILWINDGLMALFFLLVGLEIKREILIGELANFNKALLPAIAAIGGMIFPAIIFILFNVQSEWIGGWAIPVATDIAFTLGILALLGKRIPSSLKLFLASFAIVDDIGAVLIIAIFYSEKILLDYILLGVIFLALLIGYNFLGGKNLLVYLSIGILIWFFILKSGLHATIAGILLAFTIPTTKKINISDFTIEAKFFLDSLFFQNPNNNLEDEIHHSALKQLEDLCQNTETPLQKLEHALAPWVAFLIVPIFAFANAGVDVSFIGSIVSLTELISHPIILGILFGLVMGKTVGITVFVFIAHRINIITLPSQVTMIHIIGVAVLAGVGFTMSHFIASLAFSGADQQLILNLARFVILVASSIAGILGYSILYFSNSMKKKIPQT